MGVGNARLSATVTVKQTTRFNDDENKWLGSQLHRTMYGEDQIRIAARRGPYLFHPRSGLKLFHYFLQTMEETASSSKRARQPFYIWVKLGNSRAVEVDASNCRNVDALIKLVKIEIEELASVSRNLISIGWPSNGGGSTDFTPVHPALTMEDLANESRFESNDFEHPLLVQVSSSSSSASESPHHMVRLRKCREPKHVPQRSVSPQPIYGVSGRRKKLHDPERLQRWHKLNDILSKNCNRSVKRNSTAFSSVTWRDVDAILEPTHSNFLSPIKVPDAAFKVLWDYTSFASTSFELDVKESMAEQRLYFITPILVSVCNLFKGEARLNAHVDVYGYVLRDRKSVV